jgi:hypothetical protein
MSILLQRYDQIVEVEKIWNTEGKCNNPKCPRTLNNLPIYWCNAVLNRFTKRKLPLNKPYVEGEIPDRHHCIEKGSGVYLSNHFYDDYIICETDNWMVVAEKKKRQRILRNWDYINSIERYEVPKSWYDHSFQY